ncbi:MAG TPA: helix-turn-helix transcriptional regulator [Rhizomicrobium sp.]|nr:helix-turn-helix transcriptional regulator [Rhizomicrobium sp.]
MSTRPEIGKRIKKLREDLKMSKSELARQSGVTTTAVWNWEENGIIPRYETFVKAATALGVTEIFLRTGEPAFAPKAAAIVRNVREIIEDARLAIADILGVPLEKVSLKLEFSSN